MRYETFRKIFIGSATAFLASVALAAGVVINEVQSSNDTTVLDENKESPDWVELYNGATTNVSLSGWVLTDNEAKPKKWWYFPSGTTIKSKGFLRVFADSTGVEGPVAPTEELSPDDDSLKGNLVAWYRADDLTGTDGSAVTSWTDYNGKNAATGSSGKSPTLKKNFVNGHAALLFASASQHCLTIPVTSLGLSNMADVTVIVVANWNGKVNNSYSGVFGVTHGSTANNTCLMLNSTGSMRVQFDSKNYIRGGTATKNTWAAMGFTTESAGRESAETCIYYNGDEGGHGTPQSASRTTKFSSSSGMYLGYAPYKGTSGASYYDGYVSEVIVYSRALTTIEYEKLWNALAKKYGISGSGTVANLHTSFSLSGDGETLALLDPSGSAVDRLTFGALPCDTSYGRTTDAGTAFAWFTDPTPGASNNGMTAYESPLEPVTFSVERGVYDQSFTVALGHPSNGVQIVYTTDRSEPTESNGTVYGGTPITVSKTTNLRAAAFKTGHLPYRNVTTHTYLFLATVKDQQKHNSLYPTTWQDTLNGQTLKCPASYGISSNVLKTDADKAAFVAALKATPIVSVTLSDEALFNSDDGLYIHPTSMQDRESVQADVEWLTGEYVFGTGVGLDMHGAYSRRFNITAKKSFKLRFKGQFGEGSLKYPVLKTGGGMAEEYKKLVLRGENNHSWTSMEKDNNGGHPELGMSMNDQFLRNLQKQMSGFQPEGAHVHLFLNGLYWGLYNITDHVCDSFAATTWSDDIDMRKNYDVISNSGLRDGSATAFNSIKSGISTSLDSLANYNAYTNKFDYAAYIDYLLIQWFSANEDWPGNNWAVAGSDTLGIPYRYAMWDGDKGFRDNSINLTGQTSGAMEIHGKLKSKTEYKLMFADRIHKHLFNGGALTIGSITNRYAALGKVVRSFVFAESARWGAYQYENWDNLSEHPQTTKPSAPYGLTDWDAEFKRLTTSWFPTRCTTLMTQLKNAGLYPTVAAAEFTTNETRTVTLSGAVSSGTVYYTLDGSDPRVMFSGSVASGAQTYSGAVTLPNEECTFKARVRLSDGTWSALTEIHLDEKIEKTNIYLPTGHGEKWDVDANWSLGRFPNAIDDMAVIGVPTGFSKKGQRKVEIKETDVTVGNLTFINGGSTNNVGTSKSGGSLTFCSEEQAYASLVVTDKANAGLSIIDLDPPNAVRLGSDTSVIVSNTVGDAYYGGLVIKGALAGNGHNLQKLGAGRLTLACTNAAGCATIDKLQVEEGIVAVETPLEVGSVTKKTATVWLRAAGTDLESGVTQALVSHDKFNPSLCLFVPTECGSDTAAWYGGLVCADVPKSPTVYVQCATGEVGFCETRWTQHKGAVIETKKVIDGNVTNKTYKISVPYFGPTVEVTAAITGKGTVKGAGTYPRGSSVTLQATSAAGYQFAAWSTNGVEFAAEPTVVLPTVGEDVVIGARFAPNAYTVTYLANGGEGESVIVAAKYDQAITVRSCPFAKTGYSFDGWLFGAEKLQPGESVSNLTTQASGNVNLPATWRANAYRVTYEPNGGAGDAVTSNATYDVVFATIACPFARTGYTFDGWQRGQTKYAAGASVSNLTAVAGEEAVLSATWKANHYTLVYAPGDGEGEEVVTNLVYDVLHTVIACPFDRSGYEFVGWSAAEETTWLPGDTVSNLTAVAEGSVTFTALWEELPEPDLPAEMTNEVVIAVGESVSFAHDRRKNPRQWLLGGNRRFQTVAASLNVDETAISGWRGYARSSVTSTNAVVVTLTGVKAGSEDIFLGRRYKLKQPQTAVRYRVTVTDTKRESSR